MTIMGYRRQVSGSSYRINAISRVSQRQIIKRYMTPLSIQLSLAIEIALVPSQPVLNEPCLTLEEAKMIIKPISPF